MHTKKPQCHTIGMHSTPKSSYSTISTSENLLVDIELQPYQIVQKHIISISISALDDYGYKQCILFAK